LYQAAEAVTLWDPTIKGTEARRDWGWQPDYDLKRITLDMLERLSLEKNFLLLTFPDFVHE